MKIIKQDQLSEQAKVSFYKSLILLKSKNKRDFKFMKLLKYLLWSIPLAFISMIILGMYIVIWDKEIIGETFSKIWFTLGLSSFFSVILLSFLEQPKTKTK